MAGAIKKNPLEFVRILTWSEVLLRSDKVTRAYVRSQ